MYTHVKSLAWHLALSFIHPQRDSAAASSAGAVSI